MTGAASSNETNTSPYRVLLVIALLAITYLLLQGVSGTVRTPIKQCLDNFPATLGEWKVLSSRASSDKVVKMLGVDDYAEYSYANPVVQYPAFTKHSISMLEPVRYIVS